MLNVISEKQAKQIANCIVYDIQKFIAEHQLEYELFLKEELKTANDSKRKAKSSLEKRKARLKYDRDKI